MDGEKKFRVFNRCAFDVGVSLISGLSINIKPNSFAMLSVNDILYIESICQKRKFFSSKMLVPVDESGKDLSLEDLGGYTDEVSATEQKRHDTDEIILNLKKPYKAFEAWIKKIDDPSELYAIWEVGRSVDLPASKLKILQEKIPNRDLLNDE